MMYTIFITVDDLHAVDDYIKRMIKPLASTTLSTDEAGNFRISTIFRHECKAVVDALINIDVNFTFTSDENI